MMKVIRNLGRNLKWTGAIILLVGSKPVLSYFFPGLRTPGDLLLRGGLLLVYSFRIFHLRSRLGQGE